MSLIGSYRFSGIVTASGASTSIMNFTGFKPSGLTGNILGVALYTFDYHNKKWIPYSGGRNW